MEEHLRIHNTPLEIIDPHNLFAHLSQLNGMTGGRLFRINTGFHT